MARLQHRDEIDIVGGKLGHDRIAFNDAGLKQATRGQRGRESQQPTKKVYAMVRTMKGTEP